MAEAKPVPNFQTLEIVQGILSSKNFVQNIQTFESKISWIARSRSAFLNAWCSRCFRAAVEGNQMAT